MSPIQEAKVFLYTFVVVVVSIRLGMKSFMAFYEADLIAGIGWAIAVAVIYPTIFTYRKNQTK
jgi:hypothetical protein